MQKCEPREVIRDRIFEQLGIEPSCRITLVEAPVGYGKSTLLKQWQYFLKRRGIRNTMISFNAVGNSSKHFLQALIHNIYPQLSLTNVSSPEDIHFSAFMMEISNFTRNFVLLCDNIDYVIDPDCIAMISTLLQSAPHGFRFIFAGRKGSHVPLARHSVNGSLKRLNSQDLLFNFNEIHTLMGEDVSTEEVVELHGATLGWPLALSLLIPDKLAPLNQSATIDPDILHPTLIELFEHHSEEVQNFLLATAVVPSFSEQMAAYLVDKPDAANILSELRRSSFPISFEATKNCYHYNDIIRNFLSKKFTADHSDLVVKIHERAARWHLMHQQFREALHHALAADNPNLINMVIANNDGAWIMGLSRGMQELSDISKLPPATLARAPRLWLTGIYALIQTGKIASARQQMSFLSATCSDSNPVFIAEKEAMDCIILHYEDKPVLDCDIETTIESAKKNDFPPILNNLITNNLTLFAAIDAGDFDRAISCGKAACATYLKHDAIFADAYSRLRLGQVFLYQGQPNEALHCYRHVHNEATKHLQLEKHALMSRVFIAETLQLMGKFSEANRIISPLPAYIADIEIWPPLVRTFFITKLRNAAWLGNKAEQEWLIEDGIGVAHKYGMNRVKLELDFERAETAEDSDFSLRQLNTLRLAVRETPDKVGIYSPWLFARGSLSHSRLKARMEPDDTVRDLSICARYAQAKDFKLISLSADFLSKLILVSADFVKYQAEFEAILDAIQKCNLYGLAEQELGVWETLLMKRPFGVQAISRIKEFLLKKNTEDDKIESLNVNFLKKLAEQDVPLSPRERDVLDLIKEGLSGSQMAIQLGLSESSVKTYRNNLFRKFNVTDRATLLEASARYNIFRFD